MILTIKRHLLFRIHRAWARQVLKAQTRFPNWCHNSFDLSLNFGQHKLSSAEEELGKVCPKGEKVYLAMQLETIYEESGEKDFNPNLPTSLV